MRRTVDHQGCIEVKEDINASWTFTAPINGIIGGGISRIPLALGNRFGYSKHPEHDLGEVEGRKDKEDRLSRRMITPRTRAKIPAMIPTDKNRPKQEASASRDKQTYRPIPRKALCAKLT
jgi:hypothetical protein